MSDADKVHRWLTQAEFDAMLDEAYRQGIRDTRAAAIELAHDHAKGMAEMGRDCSCGYAIAGSMRGFWTPKKGARNE